MALAHHRITVGTLQAEEENNLGKLNMWVANINAYLTEEEVVRCDNAGLGISDIA